MGFLIKYFLIFSIAYLIMKGFAALLTRKRFGQSNPNYRTHTQEPPREPETQEDRIINYQKKNFEKSEAEDVEFVEIKEPKEE